MRRLRDFAKDTLDTRCRSDTLSSLEDTLEFQPLNVPTRAPSVRISNNPKDRPEYVSQLACYRKFHRSSSQIFNELKLMRVVSDETIDRDEEEQEPEPEEESLESLMYVFQVLNTRTPGSRSVSATKPVSQPTQIPLLPPLQQVLSPQVMDTYTESTDQSSEQTQPSVFSDLTQPSTPQSSAAEAHEPQLRFCPEVELVVYQRKYPLVKSNRWQDLLRLKRSSQAQEDESEEEEGTHTISKPILKSRMNHNAEREMATVRREDQLPIDDFLKRLETYDTIREEMQEYFACKRDHVIYRYNRQLRDGNN
ncbi:hypothetical protein CJU90_3745 [Yarrowia sp. C11]|nr:hypothetical protein CJU90_3745 [Yarrowia sp. C11]